MFPLDCLHSDDQAWIKRQTGVHQEEIVATFDWGKVFDTLQFGDSREIVTKKLLASKIVTSNVPHDMLGRVGLNGTFDLKENLGGMAFSLYFHWSEEGELSEVALYGRRLVPESEYKTTLQTARIATIEELSKRYGKPSDQASMIEPSDLEDGQSLSSVAWNQAEIHSLVRLGVGRDGSRYRLVIRITPS